MKRICRHFGIARWPRRSLKSKQGKLNNAIKTLSAYGSGDPGGSMHGGSMHGGSMLTGASMMSMGLHSGDGDGDGARGQSVHGPLAGGNSGNYAGLVNGHVHHGVFGVNASDPREMNGHSPRGGMNANPPSRGVSGSGFPFQTRDDDGSGSPSAAFRGHSARGGTAFGPGGADPGGGRGGSTRGGNQLLGVKRSVGDEVGARVPHGAPFFDGFAAPPEGKRGASWHGGTAAASALHENAYPSRMEKTSHGANLAFAHMGLGSMAGAGASARVACCLSRCRSRAS